MQDHSEPRPDQQTTAPGPCNSPTCGCGPACRCGEACVCTPAANGLD